MEKDFVPYEEALVLKELGFDEKCFCNWEESWSPEPEHEIRMVLTTDQTWLRPGWINAPTFSQAFRWFRDKRGLVSWISFRIDLKKKYLWYITDVKNIAARDGDYIFDILIESYEEAELACLKKLIEIANEQR